MLPPGTRVRWQIKLPESLMGIGFLRSCPLDAVVIGTHTSAVGVIANEIRDDATGTRYRAPDDELTILKPAPKAPAEPEPPDLL